MLLPRGDAGRTPTVTQFDGKIAYAQPLDEDEPRGVHRPLQPLQPADGVLTDDNYTFDAAPPIVNGTPQDLKFAKNVGGGPITKNPNFGQPLAYQVRSTPASACA